MGEKNVKIEIPGIASFARRHAEGESLEDLATEVGVSRSTLYKRLTEAGLFEAAPVEKVIDRLPQDEIVQRYEAGESPASLISYLRNLGFPANWYWVDSVLNAHHVIRHPKSGEMPKGATQGFSVGHATELRSKAPAVRVAQRRRPASQDVRRTFGNPSMASVASTLNERRLKRLAERHAEGKGQSIESLAAGVGVSASALRQALQEAGYVVSSRSAWNQRELHRLADDVVRMYGTEGMSVDAIVTHLSREYGLRVDKGRVRMLLRARAVYPGKRRVRESQKSTDPQWNAIIGREEELAKRILEDGEPVRKLAGELGVASNWLATALKRTGHLPDVNLSRLKKQMRLKRDS